MRNVFFVIASRLVAVVLALAVHDRVHDRPSQLFLVEKCHPLRC